MMVDKKEFLQDMKDEPKPCFLLIPKPKTQGSIENYKKKAKTKKAIPSEVKAFLDKYEGLILEGMPKSLPPIKDISHCIDFILGATLPNKGSYKMTPQQNEEIARQVKDLLDSSLIVKSLSPCVVPTIGFQCQ